MITRIQLASGIWHPYDAEHERVFGRIFGGIVWAGDRPGALVAVGEIEAWKPPYILHLLAVETERDNFKLISRALEFFSEYKVSNFYGRMNETSRNVLSYRNQIARGNREKAFTVIDAPFVNDAGYFEYHYNLLIDKVSHQNKTLNLADTSMPQDMLSMDRADIKTAKDTDHPAISALGYAVAALEVNRPRNENMENLIRKDKNRANYDPLHRGR